MKKIWFVFGLFMPLLAIAKPVEVVVSFSIIGDFAREVGKDKVKVTEIIKAGDNPHMFSPNPAQVKNIEKAKIIFSNGLGFEGWLTRFLNSAANSQAIHITVSDGITPLITTADSDHHHGSNIHNHDHDHDHDDDHSDNSNDSDHHDHGSNIHNHGHNHDHDDDHSDNSEELDNKTWYDPHAWQDVKNSIIYVQNIEKGLCQVDPVNCKFYRNNSQNYQQKLKALDQEIISQWAEIANENRKIIVSHNGFAYYEHAYEVEFFPILVSHYEPDAKRIAEIIDMIKSEKIKAAFIENIGYSKLTNKIVKEAGIKISGELYSDSLGINPTDNSYIKIIKRNTEKMILAITNN